MDFQTQNYNRQTPPQNKRRSAQMENAAFFLGMIAIFTVCLVYPALICGALSITFALLSRGGELTMTAKAKTGLILSSIALGIVGLMFAYTFIVANVYYDGLEDMMRQVYGSLGIDFDMLMQNYSR